jgi:GNAT superfamily N-acetyltransferase
MLETPANARPTLRAMTERDLGAAHALSVQVGWPHRLDDWRFVHGLGHGVVVCDGADRIMASAMWWPLGADFGTIGMLIVSPRLQGKGTGRLLLRALLEAAGPRSLRLNATKAGLGLYQSEGFRRIGEIRQRQGVAAQVTREDDAPSAGLVRSLADQDWPQIAALDASTYGADRTDMLRALAGYAVGHVLERQGEVVGFALCRRFGRGHLIGPMAAPDGAGAIALAQPPIAAHAGAFLRIDTPVCEGSFPRFLERSGLVEVDAAITMARGRLEPPAGVARVYAIVNQALG